METISLKLVLIVRTSGPLTVNPLPCRPGSLGLIVATSNAGLAFAAIRAGGGGASGIVHAVAGVARTRFRGIGAPCVHVPLIEFPSALSLPSYSPNPAI